MFKKLKLDKKNDHRGYLVQNDYDFISKDFRHFFISSTNPGEVRGNHYHVKKKEWFYIIQGTMELHLLDLATNNKEIHVLHDDDCCLIEMRTDTVHAFKNIGKNKLLFLALVNEKFDINNPDTIAYKIL